MDGPIRSGSDATPPEQTVETFCASLRELAPLISEHRAAIETGRRLPEPLFAALAQAGLFKLWLPKALGGAELSPIEFMTVVEAAAGLDGSVGWLVGNGGGMSRAAGYLPASVAGEWFAEPAAFVVSATGAVGKAVPTAGGYRVTGRWPFGSGAHHATRFMGLCVVADGDGVPPVTLCCYFARRDVEVIDNWHVSGLRGTGSCDFEVHDLFVPAAHTHPAVGHVPSQPGPLYRIPLITIFPWTVATVPLGIARTAMTCVADIAGRKVRSGGVAMREREVVQLEFGRAEAQRKAARAFMIAAMTQLMTAMDSGGEAMTEARAALRLACAHTADSAMHIVDAMARLAGSDAIFETAVLERCVRDVHAAVKHVAMGQTGYIVAGRLDLGLEVGSLRF